MAIYAIGDIQGCWKTLQALLKRISFSEDHDQIWLAGDLVNRGPDSLSVLRWAKRLGPKVVAVLGNHDLHLLARSQGLAKAREDDTLKEVLDAPDSDALIQWLRHRPLLHREGKYLMIHAGLLPSWDIKKAQGNARFLEGIIQGEKWLDFLENYRKKPNRILSRDPDILVGSHLLNVFTRLRVCDAEGNMQLNFKGGLENISEGFFPWFNTPTRKWSEAQVIAGHWAVLGLHKTEHVVTLDTGCVWGRSLSALRLEDGAVFQQPNLESTED